MAVITSLYDIVRLAKDAEFDADRTLTYMEENLKQGKVFYWEYDAAFKAWEQAQQLRIVLEERLGCDSYGDTLYTKGFGHPSLRTEHDRMTAPMYMDYDYNEVPF